MARRRGCLGHVQGPRTCGGPGLATTACPATHGRGGPLSETACGRCGPGDHGGGGSRMACGQSRLREQQGQPSRPPRWRRRWQRHQYHHHRHRLPPGACCGSQGAWAWTRTRPPTASSCPRRPPRAAQPCCGVTPVPAPPSCRHPVGHRTRRWQPRQTAAAARRCVTAAVAAATAWWGLEAVAPGCPGAGPPTPRDLAAGQVRRRRRRRSLPIPRWVPHCLAQMPASRPPAPVAAGC